MPSPSGQVSRAESGGIARPALVHEEYRALAPDILEGAAVGHVEIRGRLSRPAGQRHQRVRLGLDGQCRYHGDRELDAASVGIVRILGTLQRTAACLHGSETRPGVEPALGERERLADSGAIGRESQDEPGGDRYEMTGRHDRSLQCAVNRQYCVPRRCL
ncbi:MAG: hypothetical protein P8172_06575 [Gammaproteobacteria bacterium]